MSRSKQKGTGGEREVRLLLEGWGMDVERTEPGAAWDLTAWWPGTTDFKAEPVKVLATRPDNGRWLFSVELDGLQAIYTNRPWHVEVKRYARFSLHTIYESKFGKGK